MNAVFIGADAELRLAVEQALTARRVQLVEASSGAPDLAFVEWPGAGIDARAACATARASAAGAPVYVIALVKNATPSLLDEILAAGVDDWLEAPVSPALLALRIRLATLRREKATQDLERREAHLRASDERFHILARATTDIVYDWVFASSVIAWNDNMKVRFGHDLPGNQSSLGWWSEAIHPDDRARVVEGLEAAIARRQMHWSDEYRFRRNDGAYGHVLDRGTFIEDEKGAPFRMIGAMMDVTERKEMQARLVVSDRMASVGTLAAGVAHEINNPLTYVIGSITLAARVAHKLGEPCPELERARELEKLASALDAAHEGAERVRHIVRDLKTFSRSDDERRGLVDVRRVIESSISMAQNEIRHRAELVRAFSDVPPVEANESRLGQVLLNLLVNAAQSIPEGAAGRHSIRVATYTDPVGRVVIEVRDTGAGIPPELAGRIFDPFFTTKAIGEGTGLGLSICHSIVKDLGGEIDVESEVGIGSTFRVSLPAARTSDLPPQRETPSTRPGRRGAVLIVDDEPLVGDTLVQSLSDEHDVAQLDSARDALALLVRGERFDVIVCDLMMPEMTGMDLYEEVCRLAPDQAARIIFLTGGAFTPRARRFLEQVGNRWLEKPFDPAVLRAYVGELMR